MAVQSSRTISTSELVRFGVSLIDHAADITQDEGRTEPLVFGTVMAYNNDDQQWVPWTEVDATDGESIPAGIYVGDTIAAAELVAGDAVDVPILNGGWCVIDSHKIVFDGDLDLDTVVNATNEAATTPEVVDYMEVAAWQVLKWHGIHVEDTVNISAAQA